MFIEFIDPKVIDEVSTKDRVKIRIGEKDSGGRFWANLVFYNRTDFIRFAEDLLSVAQLKES